MPANLYFAWLTYCYDVIDNPASDKTVLEGSKPFENFHHVMRPKQ